MSQAKLMTNERGYIRISSHKVQHFQTLLSRMTLIEGSQRKCGAFVGISTDTLALANAGTITPRTARKIIDAYERVGE